MGLSYEKQKELLTHITTAYKDSIPVTLTNDYYYEGQNVSRETFDINGLPLKNVSRETFYLPTQN